MSTPGETTQHLNEESGQGLYHLDMHLDMQELLGTSNNENIPEYREAFRRSLPNSLRPQEDFLLNRHPPTWKINLKVVVIEKKMYIRDILIYIWDLRAIEARNSGKRIDRALNSLPVQEGLKTPVVVFFFLFFHPTLLDLYWGGDTLIFLIRRLRPGIYCLPQKYLEYQAYPKKYLKF